MCGVFTYIWLILMVNVGKYTSPMDAMGGKIIVTNLRGSDSSLVEGISSSIEPLRGFLHWIGGLGHHLGWNYNPS